MAIIYSKYFAGSIFFEIGEARFSGIFYGLKISLTTAVCYLFVPAGKHSRDPLLATLLIAKIKSSTVFASSEATSTVRYGKFGQLHLERGQQGQCTHLLRLLRSPRSPRSRSLSLLRLRRLSRSGRSPRGIRSSRSRPSRSLHRSEETPAGVDSVPRGTLDGLRTREMASVQPRVISPSMGVEMQPLHPTLSG